jgi:hypothetical protein
MADEKIQPQEVVFPNNNLAKIVVAPLSASASSVIEALGISAPKNLILLIGGADRLDETGEVRYHFREKLPGAAAGEKSMSAPATETEKLPAFRRRFPMPPRS